MKIETLICVICFLLGGIVATLSTKVLSNNDNTHHHVEARQYMTKYRLASVRYCLTEDKIVAFNGEHIPIKVPVVLYPEMEVLE